MTSRRQRRVAELLKEEIGMIAQELSDPRLTFISVTDVTVSPDLRHAHVYISHLGETEENATVLRALEHASGYIRHELALRVELRYIPELSFHIDASLERGRRIDQLLREIGLDDYGRNPS